MMTDGRGIEAVHRGQMISTPCHKGRTIEVIGGVINIAFENHITPSFRISYKS